MAAPRRKRAEEERRLAEPDYVFPSRIHAFIRPGARAFRIPQVAFMLLQPPVAVGVMFVVIYGGLRIRYGTEVPGDLVNLFLACAAPGLGADVLYLLGRLELVSDMPNALTRDAPPPPTLALPGNAGPLRPVDPRPALPVGRRRADGILFWTGAGILGAAISMALVQTDSFDAVLGIKLGGVWFHGTYWNRWWFVFYALSGCGASSLVMGFLMFVRRLNRRSE